MPKPKGFLYEHNRHVFFKVGSEVRATSSHAHIDPVTGYPDPRYSHVVTEMKNWPEMKSLIDIGRYY